MYDPLFDEYYYIGQGSKPVLDGKWYEAEPIWVTVEKAGLKAMTMFWPASEANIMGFRPTEYFVYDGSIKHDDRIKQVLSWIDYPAEKRPSFISLYFSHTDSYGHRYGPDSDKIKDAIKEMDRTIGTLVSGLKQRALFGQVNLLLVSDMGTVNVVDWTPISAMIPINNKSDALTKLKDAHPKMDVYKKGEAPERYHYRKHRRIQPITLVAKEHWSIGTRKNDAFDDHEKGATGGAHGYDQTYLTMRGIFVGHGPGFRAGFEGPGLSNIHLYEMMCRLIEIKPVKNDGSIDSVLVFLIN